MWATANQNENAGTTSWEPTPHTRRSLSINGVRYPIATGVTAMSLMAACTVAGNSVSMVYPPIGPYTAGLIRLFDASNADDRVDAIWGYCPYGGCDFSLRVKQGNTVTVYMLPAAAKGENAYSSSSLTTVVINIPREGGRVRQVDLLTTPDVQLDGLPADPEVLHAWFDEILQCPTPVVSLTIRRSPPAIGWRARFATGT